MNCEHDHCMSLRWRVASVRVYSIGRGSPFMGKTFQVQEGHRWTRSFEGTVVKKVGLWLCNRFCKDTRNKLVLACIFV